MTTRPGSCPHPIAKALEAYRARKAVRLYLRLLPVILWRDYGGSGPYTPDQVEAAIARHRVTSREFVPYAIAIFCDADAAERAWRDHCWTLDLA